MPPATPSPTVAFFRGQFVPDSEACISVKTHAFLYGTSLFEGIRAYWVPEQQSLAIFRAHEHYERLATNANIFGMELGYTVDELVAITAELLQRNAPTTDTYIRPTLFKDAEVIGPKLVGIPDSLSITSSPLGAYVAIDRGLSVCVSSWRRLSDNAIPPRAKAGGAYMNTALIKSEALNNGYDDAIVLTEEGNVSEGSAMNLFIVRNGKLITPAVTENILEGITRWTIITLAQQELGLEVEERKVNRTELYTADEVFFCGTGAQVAPVTSVDKRPVGSGAIGQISARLQSLYFDVVKNQVPRYSSWCHMVPITVATPTA
jgi:branched-chain amino acid aminotransferase